MDAGAERKFIALKRRLDALHYQQPLSKYWSIFFWFHLTRYSNGECRSGWETPERSFEDNRRLLAIEEVKWRTKVESKRWRKICKLRQNPQGLSNHLIYRLSPYARRTRDSFARTTSCTSRWSEWKKRASKRLIIFSCSSSSWKARTKTLNLSTDRRKTGSEILKPRNPPSKSSSSLL